MDLQAVMDEVATTLKGITGLRVYAWAQPSVSPPAAVLTLPESIDFDQTYGRGSDRIRDLVVVVMVGKASARTALKELSTYASGSGARSVKAKLDARTWTTCHVVLTTRVEFDTATFAGTDYLAALFHLDIVGSGA